MSGRLSRGHALLGLGLGLGLGLVAACGSATPRADDEVRRYLDDPAFRRAEMVAELVNPDNEYSRLRLEQYGRSWDQLPEWNPRVSPVTLGEAPPPAMLDISQAARDGNRDALLALGQAAFFAYPAQALDRDVALDAATRARDGLWRDGARVGGLVRVEMTDGGSRVAYTCATCHAAVRDGRVVAGLANDALDVGRILSDEAREPDPVKLGWGRGRADVSTAEGGEPVRIPDLRTTRYLTHLHVNATVAQRGLASLALRIETLIVVAHGEILRPPREVAIGLALYLWSLAPPGPAREPRTDAELRGRDAFATHCAGCHSAAGFAGPPVELAAIGVDAVGRSSARGTGTWRVPSLLGVSSRGMLFHDGSLADPASVLDPARLAADYAGGRRPGPVVEHRFGLALDASVRADLVAYLDTL